MAPARRHAQLQRWPSPLPTADVKHCGGTSRQTHTAAALPTSIVFCAAIEISSLALRINAISAMSCRSRKRQQAAGAERAGTADAPQNEQQGQQNGEQQHGEHASGSAAIVDRHGGGGQRRQRRWRTRREQRLTMNRSPGWRPKPRPMSPIPMPSSIMENVWVRCSCCRQGAADASGQGQGKWQ